MNYINLLAKLDDTIVQYIYIKTTIIIMFKSFLT